MTWEPGSILAAATLGLTVVWQLWDRIGKGNADAFSRSEAERDRLEKRVAAAEGRLDAMEEELAKLKQAHNTLLDFLRDLVSGYFADFDAAKKRAADLLVRFGGEKS